MLLLHNGPHQPLPLGLAHLIKQLPTLRDQVGLTLRKVRHPPVASRRKNVLIGAQLVGVKKRSQPDVVSLNFCSLAVTGPSEPHRKLPEMLACHTRRQRQHIQLRRPRDRRLLDWSADRRHHSRRDLGRRHRRRLLRLGHFGRPDFNRLNAERLDALCRRLLYTSRPTRLPRWAHSGRSKLASRLRSGYWRHPPSSRLRLHIPDHIRIRQRQCRLWLTLGEHVGRLIHMVHRCVTQTGQTMCTRCARNT